MQINVCCKHTNICQSSLVGFSASSGNWPTPRLVCHVATGFSTSAVHSSNRRVAPYVELNWPCVPRVVAGLGSSLWGLSSTLGQ